MTEKERALWRERRARRHPKCRLAHFFARILGCILVARVQWRWPDTYPTERDRWLVNLQRAVLQWGCK